MLNHRNFHLCLILDPWVGGDPAGRSQGPFSVSLLRSHVVKNLLKRVHGSLIFPGHGFKSIALTSSAAFPPPSTQVKTRIKAFGNAFLKV